MRYSEIYEAIKKPNPLDFGTISHGLELYIHSTQTEDQLSSILNNGFDLKYFGSTAKKFKMPDMAKHDPTGVFATEFEGRPPIGSPPWVIFKLQPSPNVLEPSQKIVSAMEKGGPVLKTVLSQAYKCSGKRLSGILLRHNIQVIHSYMEYIILDPRLIQIVRSSQD